MGTGLRGSPSWPGASSEAGYVDADCLRPACQNPCGRGGPYVHSGRWGRGEVDDGGTPRSAGRSVLRVFTRTARAGEAHAAIDRQVRRTRWPEAGAGSVLQRDRRRAIVTCACRRSARPSRRDAIGRSGENVAAGAPARLPARITSPSGARSHRRGRARAWPAAPRRRGSSG